MFRSLDETPEAEAPTEATHEDLDLVFEDVSEEKAPEEEALDDLDLDFDLTPEEDAGLDRI